jgi:hypothetical protein
MRLFIRCQRNGVDSYGCYEGQDEATITCLLAELGATDIEMITEEEYAAGQQEFMANQE